MDRPATPQLARTIFPGAWDVDEAGLTDVARGFASHVQTHLQTLTQANTSHSTRHSIMVYLSGELGAGKTTFVRALLEQVGVSSSVKSPTYTLVETYDTTIGPVSHFDLYRVVDPDELEYIGFRELTSESVVSLIEWPEKGEPLLGPPHWHVSITYIDTGRRVLVSGEFPPDGAR